MEQGFFKSLFDFSFSSFVTPKLVRVLYILSLIGIALMYVIIAIAIFGSGSTGFDSETFETTSSNNAGWGVAWLLVGGPILALIYAVFARVVYELMIVVFRIYETVCDELALLKQAHPEAAAALEAQTQQHTQQQPQAAYQQPPGPPAPPPPGPPAPPAEPPTPPPGA